MSNRACRLAGVGPDDPREMALIHKTEIGREDGEILVPVGKTLQCDRDPNSVAKLRERHPGGSSKYAADVEPCVTEILCYVSKV